MPKFSGNQSSNLLRAYRAYPNALRLNKNSGDALVRMGFLFKLPSGRYIISRMGVKYMEAKDNVN